MKLQRIFAVIVLALITLSSFNVLQAQSPAHERCAAFGKGQNISNWLEAYWRNGWPTPDGYSKGDLEKMKDAGTESIRLAIGFSAVSDTLAPYSVDLNHPLFERIDSVIKWCDDLQLNLIIDNHHGWDLTNDNWRSQLVRFSHLWSVLAQHYQHLDPERYTFELLNEPAIGFDLDSLNILFNAAIDSIRKHTTDHSIIVSPNFGSWGLAYNGYLPLRDTNLIYTWHTYDPINFTHQGFAWHEPYYPAGIVFPNAQSVFEQFLYRGWDEVIQWRDMHNKPVFLGEFGVSGHADAESRCRWIEFIGLKILQNDIPWFYWDWRYDFFMFYSGIPIEDSIIPCFKSALQLYGDTSFTSVKPEVSHKLQNVLLYPSIVTSGGRCHLAIDGVKGFRVILFDPLGRSRYQKHFKGKKADFPLDLDKGIYFLAISSGEKATVRKVIIY